MPPKAHPRPRFFYWIANLVLMAASTPALADDFYSRHWMNQSAMQRLPLQQQRPIRSWCGATYYNPQLATPSSSTDTVLTASETELTEDGPVLLRGQVEIFQPGRELFAEQASYDQASGAFSLDKGVQIDLPNASFGADHVSGNVHDNTLELQGGQFTLFDQQARGGATSINQQGPLIHIRGGSYTTCAPNSGGWLISAKEMELDRDKGWGEAKHVLLKVEDVPVLYLPWITFPIDDRRKTGLLFPSLAFGDHGGVDIGQPLYLNLHPQMDATVSPRYIDGRGSGLDTEFRYLIPQGTGTLSLNWLYRDRLFDDEDRTASSWKHSGRVGRWLMRSDVNYVSDDFYFKDLETGLEVSSQTHLPRELEAQYFGEQWRFLARVQAWQTLDPNLAASDIPFRRLPQLQLSGAPLVWKNLRLDFLGDYTYFERNAYLPQDNIAGHRSHFQPAVSWRFENSWGYVLPRVRFYDTRYLLDGVDTLPSKTPQRQTTGANLDAGIVLERPFQFRQWQLMQTLEPRVFVNYLEYQDQTNLPNFDGGEITQSWDTLFRENRYSGYDRLGDEHSTTLGLTSRFVDQEEAYDVLTLRLAQKYFQRDRRVDLSSLPGAPPVRSYHNTRDRSAVIADATLRLNNRWSLFADTHWNSETDQREQNSLRLGYSDQLQRFVHLGYQYRPLDDIRQAELGAMLPIHRHWSLIGRWLYDLDNKQSVETITGVEYRDCCWRIRLVSQRELVDLTGNQPTVLESNRTTLFQIQLTGLGGLGGRLDTLLERSIPGYRRDYD